MKFGVSWRRRPMPRKKRSFKGELKVKLGSSYKKTYDHVHDFASAFSSISLSTVIWTAAAHLRHKVYENIRREPLDYVRTGGFLKAVSDERVKKFKVSTTIKGKRRIFTSGAGSLEVLNKVVRPKETVTFETPSGQHRTLSFKKGTFPIWIMVEYGILNRGEQVPKEFTKYTKKKTSLPYRMVFAGWNVSNNKPVIFMSKNVPVSYPHHPGVKGSGAYRRALRELYKERFIEKLIDETIARKLKD